MGGVAGGIRCGLLRPRPYLRARLGGLALVLAVALGVSAGLIGPSSPAAQPSSDLATAAGWVLADSVPTNEVSTPAPWPSAVRALRLQTTWSALPLVAALVVLLRAIAALLPPAAPGTAPVASPGLRGRATLFAYLN